MHCSGEGALLPGRAVRSLPRRRPLLLADCLTVCHPIAATGIDIDGSQQVSVRDTEVDTADDAICLKTTTPGHPLANVTVSDCRCAEGLCVCCRVLGERDWWKGPQPASGAVTGGGVVPHASAQQQRAACSAYTCARSSAAYPATRTPGCAPAPPPSSWAARVRQTCSTSALRGCP